jgi:predicted RNase H-like nuclease (RuvC/YqgF family)
MSKNPNIVVAFPRGGIIPAAVLETSDDVPVRPHEPIEVPKVYGNHLISDRIAYDYAEAEKQKKAAAASASEAIDAARADAAALETLNQKIALLTSENNKLTADLGDASNKISALESDKVKLSGEVGSLQTDLKDAGTAHADELDKLVKELEVQRKNVATLTEQLAEATKPPVQQQESLKMEGEGSKSK